jgi:hypothetical protein
MPTNWRPPRAPVGTLFGWCAHPRAPEPEFVRPVLCHGRDPGGSTPSGRIRGVPVPRLMRSPAQGSVSSGAWNRRGLKAQELED